MTTRRTIAAVFFYLGLGLLMATILFNVLQDLIPRSIAVRIGYNSEGYIAALILAAWIEFVRPRLTGRRMEWPITIAAAVALAVLGVVMVESDWPSRVKTLNEAMLGLALVIPYVQLRRPLPTWLAVAISVFALAAIVVFNHTDAVTRYAEGFMLIVLAPLAFDVFDRGILSPGRRVPAAPRYIFYALLVLLPIASSLIYHAQLFHDGIAGEWIRYEVRVHESFICMLLVLLYFATRDRLGRGANAAVPRHRRREGAADIAASSAPRV